MSGAIRARRAFILGLIYGVLDYDVFVCEGGDCSLAASPWDVSHNYPRNRRILRALPSYTNVTKIPLPYGIVITSLRHYAVITPSHCAVTWRMSDIVSRHIHTC